ncbi:intraflagellar transport 46 isoform X2 [Brevipalpus obovatus]|uniref:intraflagellar transport 46 isoform X2 n=1 Tax=Brevipalpus obovatus TaxID=246614 RepID=UPI003D9F969A
MNIFETNQDRFEVYSKLKMSLKEVESSSILSKEDEDEDDGDEEGENEDQLDIEGAYDPKEFSDLDVNPEVKALFQYIESYTPQIIDLEMKLKPFIPDYIPAVGDIDPFLKVPRPDNIDDGLGLVVIDEPSSCNQSDPTLLNLKLRAVGKEVSKGNDQISVVNVARSTKDIDSWIENIRNLHRITASSATNVSLLPSKRLPALERLMEEWDSEFENALSQFQLPTADMDVSLDQYIGIICALLDIPIHHSKLSSLHLLFNLYHEFQSSQHFKRM